MPQNAAHKISELNERLNLRMSGMALIPAGDRVVTFSRERWHTC